MSKTEVMHSLRKELKEEILPYYNNVILHRLRKEVLPFAQRTGTSQKKTFEKKTSGMNIFYMICSVTKKGHNMELYCKFTWNGKPCYASFFNNEIVVVYQKHCLERYAERVLGKDGISSEDIFKKYLFNKQDSAFQIVLQAPKRERCRFFGLADALFLGDVEEPTEENKNDSLYWYNTCLSLKETRETQTGILRSLTLMQKYVKELGFNPLDKNLSKEQKKIIKDIKTSTTKQHSYVEFLKRSYMLHQLQLSLDFPWIGLYMDEINYRMNMISTELAKFSVRAASLSPFGKEVGFAIKGEINYRGNNSIV